MINFLTAWFTSMYSLHKSQSYNCYIESDTVCRLSFYRLYCIETLCWLQEKTNIFHPLVCHRRLNTLTHFRVVACRNIKHNARMPSSFQSKTWTKDKDRSKGNGCLFWGQNFFNSLLRQLFCTRTILKNRMNLSFSSNHPGAIHHILQIVLVHTAQQLVWRRRN